MVLATITIPAAAQSNWRKFISHGPGESPITTIPAVGEIRQSLAGSRTDLDAENSPECKAVDDFPSDVGNDIVATGSVTGLLGDVLVKNLSDD
jgi:hypothetical protein